MFPSLVLFSFLLISGTNSFLVVKNVTVHSDVLRESFINAIRTNSEIPEIRGQNLKLYDPKKCILSLKKLGSVGSSEGFQFFDAWGKIPSGIKSENFYDIGNFDQCIQSSVNFKDVTGAVSGQFCFAQLPLQNASLMNGASNDFTVNIGICVPDSCSPDIIASVFKQSNGVLSDVSISQCTNGKSPPYEVIHIVGIIVFSIVATLMMISSFYECYMNYSSKQPVPVLLAFSVLTNGRKMFAINTTKSPNNIDCLSGLRVLSMIWIIYHHTNLIRSFVPKVNEIVYSTWYKDTMWSMVSRNAAITVDTFFFMGGLLVAWSGFRELDKTNGKLNVIMMYVHRYIRLTPAVAAILLFNNSLNEIVYSGPFRDLMLSRNKCDSSNWWPILLYIQNYIVKENNCLDETWYLAVDFHLYVISPLLLILMWRWGKKFAPVLLALALTSIGYVVIAFLKKGFTGLLIGTNDGEWTLTNIPTHARIAAWLVGFALGYFMHVNRQKSFQIPKFLQILAWIGSFTILFSIVFGPHFIMNEYGHSTNIIAAMFEGWKRILWATALAWITFACHFGFGGILNSFLSHPFWQPFARLAYTLFLVHMTVLRLNLGMLRTHVYFSGYGVVLSFWSAFGTSLKFAILLALAFESPILVLEKYIFHKEKSEEKTKAQ